MTRTPGVAVQWIAIYLILVLAPLGVLMAGPMPPGNGFAWDFSMALGFSAVAMLGVQFVLTARFRRVSAPFGVDILYYFHRYMAVFALALVLVHYGIIRATNPGALGVLNPSHASGHMTAGRAALLCFTVVIVSSIWRRPLKLPYETWRVGHVSLTTLGLVLAVAHIEGVDYYIDAPGRRIFWILFAVCWIMVVVYVRLLKPIMMLRHPYRVIDVRRETANTATVAVEPVGHLGFRFQPGQFAWVSVRASPFALKEHPFSISSSADGDRHIEFTVKNLGDFTSTIPDLNVGETVHVDGPYGAFSVDRHPAPGFVFVAGGVGIAPIMSMIRTLADRGDRRPLVLVYANSSDASIIFYDELQRLQSRLPLNVVHVLNEPPAGWPGECGLVTSALLEKHLPANRCDLEYFLCGPQPLTRCVEEALHALGVPTNRMHTEIFNLV